MLPKTLRVARPARMLRNYHSVHHANSNLIIDPSRLESKILTKACSHMGQYGPDPACVTAAIREMGYADSLQSLFTSQTSSVQFQLCLHWLKLQRQNLNEYIVDPKSTQFHSLANEYERVEHLITTRLLFNEPIHKHLSTLLSQLIIPYNVPQSMSELHNLSDDITFYAGDCSNDFAWYSKRFAVSSIYVSSELYMVQDKSEGFKNTKKFVSDKVSEFKSLGDAYSDIEQWSVFNAISLANLIRSQLIRG